MGDRSREELRQAEVALFARYGLDVEESWIDLDEPHIRVRVLEVGSGPPLLLVHGGGGSAAVWAPLMAPLQNAFRLLAVDRPGCGMSDSFDYTGLDIRRHGVAFLGSTLDALGLEHAPIAGNSMGGLWALWLALDRPARVTALAQLGCPALILGTSVPHATRLLAARAPDSPAFRGPVDRRKLAERLVGRAAVDRIPDEVFDCMMAAHTLPEHQATRSSLLAMALTPTGARPEVALGEEELARIRQPVAFVWGAHDGYGPPSAGERACRVMPDATLEVLPTGHLPWLEHPGPCAEAILTLLLERLPIG